MGMPIGFHRPPWRPGSRQLSAWRGACDRLSCGSGEDAVIDPDQDFEHAALLTGVAAFHELFRGTAVKEVARRDHPAASLRFIPEDLDRAIPDRIGVGMLQFLGQLFRRCWRGSVQAAYA